MNLFRINKSDISYAGTKDAKAVIIQHLSIYSTSEVKIQHPKIEVLEVSPFFRHLQLGELLCNKFDIRISNMEYPNLESVRARLRNIEENGFVNYFGMQRFGAKTGSKSACTPSIGLALIAGDYGRALELAFETEECDERTSEIVVKFRQKVNFNHFSETKTVHRAALDRVSQNVWVLFRLPNFLKVCC